MEEEFLTRLINATDDFDDDVADDEEETETDTDSEDLDEEDSDDEELLTPETEE